MESEKVLEQLKDIMVERLKFDPRRRPRSPGHRSQGR
jgi:hypothetical protein